ncbi:hypothetical protein JXA02_06970 [candidate division KSB1 bacterium]|nr:hypothetical protein [candidate division KSB1 bacterium]RQW06765.1 MAG: hypothetical protein EH222_08105 [candidate division KSB1 bacterium]
MKTFSCISILFFSSFVLYATDWTNFTAENSGLASNMVKVVVVDPSGNKWFGTDKGLSAYDGAKWVTHVKDENKQTLADNDINDIAFEESSYGPELWIATANGASVISIPSIDAVTMATPYRTDNTGIIDNHLTSVAVDPLRHEQWFGTFKGASRFSSSGWRSFDLTTNPVLAWTDVTCIGVDPDSGWKYFGTKNGVVENNGVARLRTSLTDVDAITAPSPYSSEWSGLWSPNVYAAFMDADGSQWFGTDTGFGYHDTTETKAGWEFFTVDDGLVHSFVQAIVRADERVMWIGTSNGLSKFTYKYGEWGIEVDDFTNLTVADGLVSNNIFDLAVDRDGSLWIATDNGVSHFTGETGIDAPSSAQNPQAYGLMRNYPNPFNSGTTISYTLPCRAHVELSIVNLHGERIYGLLNTMQSAGSHSAVWNGRLSNGGAAPTGIYVALLSVAAAEHSFKSSLKMLMVK